MAMKVALRVTLKATLPMSDASPEAYRDAIQKLDALKGKAEEAGFQAIAVTTTVGNTREPAKQGEAPTGAPTPNADRAGAAGAAAVESELGKPGGGKRGG